MNKHLLTPERDILSAKFKELNSICAYLAMFPSEVPEEYILKYTKKGDVVFDPFSGRGTTALQAIKHQRVAISTDLSPLAYVLTRSKTTKVNFDKVTKRILSLKQQFINNKNKLKFNYNDIRFRDIKIFYSEKNLEQLFFLREKIGKKYKKNNDVDNLILSISLGIAHGKTRKTGDKNNSLYFSVSMPNGMSMAPRYAEKYIKNNSLHKIETDIFDQILKRLEKKRSDFLEPLEGTKAYLHNALNSSELFNKGNKPKLIFTSPPYLNLIKYIDQNWIRFWLLGYDRKEKNADLLIDDCHAKDNYIVFIKKFMNEMYEIMDKDTKFMMVIGDVNDFKIKDIMNEIFEDKKISSKFKMPKRDGKMFKNGNPAKQPLKNKLSRQMGNRVGKATENDWVFLIRRK